MLLGMYPTHVLKNVNVFLFINLKYIGKIKVDDSINLNLLGKIWETLQTIKHSFVHNHTTFGSLCINVSYKMYFWHFILHGRLSIHIWRQQFVDSFFFTVGVSRSKSIIRILVADVFVFLASFAFFVLGEMPLRNRMGAWGAPVPFATGSIPPPVLSMTYVNSGPSPQPEITFFVTANNKR